MINKLSIISLITLLCISFVASSIHKCTWCVQKEKCKEFRQLELYEQKAWEQKFTCSNTRGGKIYGSAVGATGDYVCCPSAQEALDDDECPITSFPPKPETGCCGRQDPDDFFWTEPDYSRRVRRSPVEKRIVGGSVTELEEYPWTVLVHKISKNVITTDKEQCGGSLISSRYVLTAAHCVYDKKGKDIKGYNMIVEVYLAEYDLSDYPTDCKIVIGEGKRCVDNVLMNVEEVIPHPKYDDEYLKNDIALIRLSEDAPYTKYIRPICLPSINVESEDFVNQHLAVAGWGYNGTHAAYEKQSAIVNLVSRKKCQEAHKNLYYTHMCAVGTRGQDSCKGDSGGPLMKKYNDGKYVLVGVVSGQKRGSSCGTMPALYTNVYHYRDWIRINIKN